jgi:hypothetical protein
MDFLALNFRSPVPTVSGLCHRYFYATAGRCRSTEVGTRNLPAALRSTAGRGGIHSPHACPALIEQAGPHITGEAESNGA